MIAIAPNILHTVPKNGVGMAKFMDLTGKKFGELTPLKYLGKKCNKSVWLVICSCGKKINVMTHNLASGRKTSCGCQRGLSVEEYKERLEERLLSKRRIVEDCWEWTGFLNNAGYGRMGSRDQSKNHKNELVHRVSYELYNGKIPKGKFVCHTCDNPACFNPEHLWVGTQKDNMKDMYSKNRYPIRKGEDSPQAKINEEKVIAIRKMKNDGLRGSEISEELGISRDSIYSILSGKTWRYLDE